jgi:hypothetical protein
LAFGGIETDPPFFCRNNHTVTENVEQLHKTDAPSPTIVGLLDADASGKEEYAEEILISISDRDKRMPIKIGNVRLYTIEELSKLLGNTIGITMVMLQEYIYRGDLKARKIDGRWLISEESLNEFFLLEPTNEEKYERKQTQVLINERTEPEQALVSHKIKNEEKPPDISKDQVKSLLISYAKQKTTISYSVLLSIAHESELLDQLIKDITIEEHVTNKVLITAIIVHNSELQAEPVPNGTFLSIAEKLGYQVGKTSHEKYAFWRRSLDAVFHRFSI